MSKLAWYTATVVLTLTLGHSTSAEDPGRPNIVFVLADDLGWADVGYHGAEDIKTPHIDRLATSGVKLESCYAMPMCSPSRAALMTGRFPMRYGMQTFVITPGQRYGVPTDERMLAQELKEAGYGTYAVGKWHLGHSRKAYWPQNRGFDYFYGTTIGNVDYFTKERGGVVDWQRNGEYLTEEGYITDLITDDAVRIIERQSADKPFFLYMAHLAVHSPYQAPQRLLDRYEHIPDETRRAYAAMATAMDDSVGRVMDALARMGLLENTVVVFSSDNGGIASFDPTLAQAVGKKPAPADNGPFRGSKASQYEGGIRVPTVVSWPGRVKPGAVAEVIHIVDWLPTFLGLAGAEPAGRKPLDGRDVWGVITKGDPSPHRHLLLNLEFHRGAIREGNWKLVKHAALPSRTELFDLEVDPGEEHDLAANHPARVIHLEALLNEYAGDAKPSLFIKEYMPFIRQDAETAEMVYEGDEDSGQPGERPALPR